MSGDWQSLLAIAIVISHAGAVAWVVHFFSFPDNDDICSNEAVQVIPTPSHLLDRISPIVAPFFLVFCAFSPPRRGGSNEPQAGAQGQETAGKGAQTPLRRPS